MTDGDCPTQGDATVILVDSLERAFQHNPPTVHVTARVSVRVGARMRVYAREFPGRK